MDTPTSTYIPPRHSSHKRLWIVLIAGALVLLAAAGAAWLLQKWQQTPEAWATRQLYVVGPAPFAQAFTEQDTTLVPVSLPGYEDAYVLDAVSGARGTYYLARTADIPGVQLYVHAFGSDTAERLTTSDTIKYQLSIDPTSDTLAYLSVPNEDFNTLIERGMADVMRFENGVEQQVTEAFKVDLLARNEGYLLAREDALYYLPYGENQELVSLLTVLPGTPYAINTEGTRLAVLNRQAQSVDVFDIANGIRALSYLESIAVSAPPDALSYEGEVLQVSSSKEGTVMHSAIGAQESVFTPATSFTGRVWKVGTFESPQ